MILFYIWLIGFLLMISFFASISIFSIIRNLPEIFLEENIYLYLFFIYISLGSWLTVIGFFILWLATVVYNYKT